MERPPSQPTSRSHPSTIAVAGPNATHAAPAAAASAAPWRTEASARCMSGRVWSTPAPSAAEGAREDATSDGQTSVRRQHLRGDGTACCIGRRRANDATRSASFVDVGGVHHGRWIDTVRRSAAATSTCCMIEQRSCHGFPSRRAEALPSRLLLAAADRRLRRVLDVCEEFLGALPQQPGAKKDHERRVDHARGGALLRTRRPGIRSHRPLWT